jgi:nitrate reductase NapE component
MNHILFLIFTILIVLDGYTTYRCLQLPSNKEGNPVLRFFMDKIGLIPTLILTRLIIVGLFGYCLWQYNVLYLTYALGALCILFAGVQVNNILRMRRKKRRHNDGNL